MRESKAQGARLRLARGRGFFGAEVRERREALGLSQRHVARSIGIHVTYLSKIENGATDWPPSQEATRKLAKILRLDETALLALGGRISSGAVAALIALEDGREFLRRVPKLLPGDWAAILAATPDRAVKGRT